MYVAWYINKQLLDVCSMICKQTITGSMICKHVCRMYVAYVNKQTITGCNDM